jgi:uncharacterized protein
MGEKQDADYDGVNIQWFRARFPHFVYIDRIIGAESHQGFGIAQRLYLDLFERTQAAGAETIGWEVNLKPSNPGSNAFHARMRFNEVGQATLPGTSKTVRYLTRKV